MSTRKSYHDQKITRTFTIIIATFMLISGCQTPAEEKTEHQISIDDPDVVWVGTITTDLDLSKYSKYKVDVKKSEGEKTITDYLIDDIMSGELTAYDYDYNLLSKEEVNEMIVWTDTVSVYNYDTGENEYVEEETNIRDNIDVIKLKQDLYYNIKSKEINTKMKEIGLVSREYDDQGNFLGNLHRFWIKLVEEPVDTVAESE